MKLTKFKNLLFDLDGTLTDPKEGITTSVQYALKSFGIDEPNLDKLEPFIGPPLKDSFMKYYGFDEEKAEKAVAKYREWFAPTGIFQNKIFPGIADMLKELKEEGKVLAVASSKPTVFVEKILRHFDIYHYFDVVVGSELNGVRGSKEEVVEEALLQLANRTGKGEDKAKAEHKYIDKEHTVMIGDRE
ncbi:MAG: HAD hydrolase-like protein, partial [Clostridiales bacterium]|nr:HAD hydrolase-like protein [Clostridiales bacterium]